MRTLSFLLLRRTTSLLSIIRRPLLLPLHRSLHVDAPSNPTSQILIHPNPNPNSLASSSNHEREGGGEEEDAFMTEFLSRFVHSIRPVLADAYPSLPRQTLDSMLLLICRRVVSEVDPSADPSESVELSEDLWKAVHEASRSVHEAMRRDRVRNELKKYLHSDDVKEMCRFAGDVGVRGDMMRELRFKWAREKMEEVEFYRELEKIRESESKEEEAAPAKVAVEVLPERKGKIKYKIYGLDLSDKKWREVAERAEEAEGKILQEEAKPVVGRSKRAEEKVYGLNWKTDDIMPVLKEWAEALGARRVDWLALLERIKEKNVQLYLKVAELLLTEESFEPNIRDFSKLIDAYSKADKIQDAERILNKMTENGIEPDILTYIILLHMYSKVGDLDRAKDAFESLKTQGFQPDLKAYTSMITAYVKAGHPKQGENLTREMEARDIRPTKEIYMELLRSFAEQGQVDGAQRIMNTMQFSGIQPTLESSTLLVEAYGQSGDPDQARGQFDQMRKAGHKPDDQCTASMVAAYAKKNLLDKALDLLLTLEQDGFKPGIATKSVLVDWLGRLQLVEEAERVLEEIAVMGEAPFQIHVSLCDMYSRAGNEEKAKKSLKVLEGKKRLLRADQFERIVSGLLAGGMVEDAKRMYQSMQGLGHTPSEPLKVTLMAAQSIPRQKPGTRRW
ncbi:pentatricopeptide repeat-containing protein-like [Iris pallida]|uniref:Pentatricopeptide repeat-containing protein-like n=1 Tax=Iris pallida TaxID=29817 RepID=A0AAX6DUP4_IRIPA|nr:pentatricopeptide repeat-containing protein-like [Iris pallida]